MAGSAVLLSACADASGLDSALRAFDFALYGQPDVPLERSTIERLAYASIRAKIGLSGRVLMILGRYEGDDLHWISADRVALVTRAGRLVKTAGLAGNLRHTILIGPDPLAQAPHRLRAPQQARRTVDLESENRYGVGVSATLAPLGRARIEILEREYETLVLREEGRAETIAWEFTNYFWVDAASGFVWRSHQQIAPGIPAVEIEVLKPAA